MGTTTGMLVVAFAGITGGAFNPSRLIGQFLLSNSDVLQVFILIGQFSGAIIGSIFYREVMSNEMIRSIFEDDEIKI